MWLFAIGLAALLLFWWVTAPTTYRYKLTVEVETPEGLRTGSAVRQVSWTKGMKITPEADTATMTHKGEAAIVDLPGGRTLFALMSPDGQETPMLAFGSARQSRRSDRSIKILTPPAKPEPVYGKSGYPRLVMFRDIKDPKTVEKVDPTNFAASFGAGYRLKRITAQIVDEPVARDLKNILPWIIEYRDKLFSGERYQSLDGINKYGLAATLGMGSFISGFNK